VAGKQRYTVEKVIEALKATKGRVYLAARRLRCDPNTVINYKNRYPQIAQACAEQEEERLDIAESALDKAVANGESWAVCFTLKCKGKHRGYVEKTVIAHGGDAESPAIRTETTVDGEVKIIGNLTAQIEQASNVYDQLASRQEAIRHAVGNNGVSEPLDSADGQGEDQP
jgi:hypothetical protein